MCGTIDNAREHENNVFIVKNGLRKHAKIAIFDARVFYKFSVFKINS